MQKKGFCFALFALLGIANVSAQQLAIVGCSSTTALSGHDCTKAYDKNTSTDFEGRTNSPAITLDLGAIHGIKKVVVTWGTNVPVGGVQMNFKLNAADSWTDVQGVDNPTGTSTTFLLTWAQQSPQWVTMDTARYIQIQGYGNVSAMDIKEVAVSGSGVYVDNEILTATFPITQSHLTGGTAISLSGYGSSFPNRIVGMGAVIYGNDGNVQNIDRLAGKPFNKTLTPAVTDYGGYVHVSKNSGSGLWEITVNPGPYFTDNPNYASTNLSFKRGDVTIYYLSHDPDYLFE